MAETQQVPKGDSRLLDDGRLEVTLSTGRVVLCHELNGLEQANADGCVETKAMQLVSYYRTAHSIDKIDGTDLPKIAGKANLDARLGRLKGSEIDALAYFYNKAFGAPLQDDTVKNSSGDDVSTPAS